MAVQNRYTNNKIKVLFVITRLPSTIVATHWIIVKVKVEKVKVKTNVFEV